MENQDNTMCYSSTCSEATTQFAHLNNDNTYSSVHQTHEYPYSTLGTMVADASTMEYSMTSPLPTVVDTNLCEYPSNDGSLNNISMPYFQEESLSGASVASSLDINTPEIPPISDVAMVTVMPSEVVAQSHLCANQSSHIQDSMSYNINTNTSYEFNSTAHQWENSQNNNATFQTGLQHESVVDTRMWPQNPTPNSNLAQNSSSYINSQENDHATGIISMSHDETQSINMQLLSSNNSNYPCPQEQTPMQQDLNIDEKNWRHPSNTAACSQANKPSNRRHTISYYTDSTSDSSEKCSKLKKKLKRRSMNDCTTRKVKVESFEENAVPDLPDKFAKSSFGHLSREELIQRVVQLEKEKRLSKQLDATSEKNNSNPSQIPPLDNSDEEDSHSCQWSDCNTVTATLDHLIVHIQDTHIGSGKPAYYCQWAGCPRNQKPFLKRHKMQNHMRTHTGERPFVCQVEGCDKRFSRPDSLNTHIKTHSSIRPYMCPVPGCGKAYFHSRSLRKHAKSHEPSSSACTSPTDVKEEYYRHYQYEKSMNPIYYQPQMITCGSEARKTQVGFAQYEPTPIPNHRPAMPFVPNAGGALGDGYYQDTCTLIPDSHHPEPTFYQYQEQQQVYTAGPVNTAVPSTSYNNANTGHLQVTGQSLYNFGQQYYIY